MEFVLFLGTAFGLGGFHALEPGHGKTIIAAYLVGSRGPVWEALLLGLVVAVTHTSSVIALGVASLFAASLWTDLATSRFIGLVSGLAIIIVGLWMLVTRWKSLSRSRDGSHVHNHGGGRDPHYRDHHHHDKLTPGQERISLLQIMSLGISGGLVPCPAALVVLLGSLSSGEIASGLTYLLMFSLGVASVLVALGLVVSKATDLATRYLETPGLAALASIGSAVLIIGMGAFVMWQAVSG